MVCFQLMDSIERINHYAVRYTQCPKVCGHITIIPGTYVWVFPKQLEQSCKHIIVKHLFVICIIAISLYSSVHCVLTKGFGVRFITADLAAQSKSDCEWFVEKHTKTNDNMCKQCVNMWKQL